MKNLYLQEGGREEPLYWFLCLPFSHTTGIPLNPIDLPGLDVDHQADSCLKARLVQGHSPPLPSIISHDRNMPWNTVLAAQAEIDKKQAVLGIHKHHSHRNACNCILAVTFQLSLLTPPGWQDKLYPNCSSYVGLEMRSWHLRVHFHPAAIAFHHLMGFLSFPFPPSSISDCLWVGESTQTQHPHFYLP